MNTFINAAIATYNCYHSYPFYVVSSILRIIVMYFFPTVVPHAPVHHGAVIGVPTRINAPGEMLANWKTACRAIQ